MAILLPFPKHPDEVIRYAHDWSDALLFEGEDIGDTLIDDSDPDPGKRPAATVVSGDAVIDSFTLVNLETQYVLSGGTQDTRIKLSVQTTLGRKFVDEIVIKIKT